MKKLVKAMSPRQCEIAAEAYTACLLAQAGYDVLVQYGAHQPQYDMVAVKESRTLKISVKGSQTGGWMLAVKHIKKGVSYLPAIDEWEKHQALDVIFVFVQFWNVQLGQAPRAYIARAQEVAQQLRAQRNGKGHGALRENVQSKLPGSKCMDRLPPKWVFKKDRIDSI